MKKYFAQLRPLERRMAVGVLVVLFLVLNGVFIYPHFSDWGNLRRRLETAQRKLNAYHTVVGQMPLFAAQVKSLQNSGEFVAAEDMSVNMLRTIQTQSAQSGVAIINTSRQTTRTNDAFFVEQVQNINVIANDQQLVDFLYKLGSGASMIRVRDLELQPDVPRQHLNANIRLVASYQKNATPDNLKSATAKAK
jgi:type II secretory pathway component PulM